MQFDIVHITSLFENATEGLLVTDSNGVIILVNPSACNMFGYQQDDLAGQQIEILIPSHFKTDHVHLRNGFYSNPHNRVMGHGRDLFAQKKDGSSFPVEVSLSTYLREDKRYVIAFIVDITHRKEIEKNMLEQQIQLEKITNKMRIFNAELEAKVEERTIILKEALQQLEQSQSELSLALDKEKQLNEIKSRFVSMASHEFRTPLSTVMSSASLIGKYTYTEDQDKRNRHIEKIKGSVKNLNDLLEDFLSLGKLDEGKVGATFEEFNLNELLIDTIADMDGLKKKGQEFVYNYSGNEMIISDKKLVRNVMFNLISNAIKFSEESTPIEIICCTDNGVSVSVKDSGIGITNEDKQHLFTSFFRGKNATNIQGTGLGLHIVRRYIDLLGGIINLESELGKGTNITFTLVSNKL